MLLGVSYSLWDGEELLEHSIKSIRRNVDYISVVYQEVSNHGQPCAPGLRNMLEELMSKGLIDNIHLFVPDLADTGGENASINETRKRNIGLNISRAVGCSHHMTIDTDEFYTDGQFRYMKEIMGSGDFGTAYCQHCQYYKDSIYILKNKEQEYVAAIEKITPETKYVYMIEAPVAVDPTRKTNNTTYRIFTRDEVEMHHMSFVRKDIRKKLMNHSSRRFFTEEGVNMIAEYYDKWVYPMPAMWAGKNLLEVIEVPRLFDIYKID